jgi:hypothetical protein
VNILVTGVLTVTLADPHSLQFIPLDQMDIKSKIIEELEYPPGIYGIVGLSIC